MNSSTLDLLFWFAVFFGIIYFIIIRPNNKQQKERRLMLDSLKEKDKVVTIGGLHGTVTKILEDTVMIKVAPNIELEYAKTSVQSIQNRDYKQAGGKSGKHNMSKTDKIEQSKENPKSDVLQEAPQNETGALGSSEQ
ncbi:MAG: hypothetical protein AWM53_00319 [Candidatus Dichloromethanomonas elyunquensis]|nr:MAG: hypothetical protein AWM53_00319 [Candidatus Dichloromethanomonas elyunquensis]